MHFVVLRVQLRFFDCINKRKKEIMTEPQPQLCAQNLVKFGRVVSEICAERTNTRHHHNKWNVLGVKYQLRVVGQSIGNAANYKRPSISDHVT